MARSPLRRIGKLARCPPTHGAVRHVRRTTIVARAHWLWLMLMHLRRIHGVQSWLHWAAENCTFWIPLLGSDCVLCTLFAKYTPGEHVISRQTGLCWSPLRLNFHPESVFERTEGPAGRSLLAAQARQRHMMPYRRTEQYTSLTGMPISSRQHSMLQKHTSWSLTRRLPARRTSLVRGAFPTNRGKWSLMLCMNRSHVSMRNNDSASIAMVQRHVKGRHVKLKGRHDRRIGKEQGTVSGCIALQKWMLFISNLFSSFNHSLSRKTSLLHVCVF